MRSLRSHPALATSVALATFSASIAPHYAQAGLVTTEQAQDVSAKSADRERVANFMARQDVRNQLSAFGVDPEEATARVSSLSDAEIANIAARIDDMPAGGDAAGAIIGAAVLIFLVLLVTDLLGLTNVFPFTKSARR